MRPVFVLEASPRSTTRVVSSNDVQILPAEVTGPDGVKASFVFISIEDNPVRVAFGGDEPGRGGSPVGHFLEAGDAVVLSSWSAIRSFRFTNAVQDSDAVLQVTTEV